MSAYASSAHTDGSVPVGSRTTSLPAQSFSWYPTFHENFLGHFLPPCSPCITFSNRLVANQNPPSTAGRQFNNYLSKLKHIDPFLRLAPCAPNLRLTGSDAVPQLRWLVAGFDPTSGMWHIWWTK
jgi:hypothetical protein